MAFIKFTRIDPGTGFGQFVPAFPVDNIGTPEGKTPALQRPVPVNPAA
jgi:hypothetical protein